LIDVHCHILPGLDDGAESLEESIKIAELLVEAGYDTVIATPHVIEGREYVTPRCIRSKVVELNKLFVRKGICLKVLPGAENYIFPDMADWYKKGILMTLGDTKRYILVELPMQDIPTYTEQVFFDLQIAGITPILAHPERNRCIVHHPEKLFEWVDKGVQLQVNLGSFSGRYGEKTQELAETLLLSGMAHYMGTDLHKSWKSNYLKSITYIMQEFKEAKFVAAATENPINILGGKAQTFSSPEYFVHKKKHHGTWNWLKVLVGKV